jgi:hypothetical protein
VRRLYETISVGSTVHVREMAAQALGTPGPAAQIALPELIRLSRDTNAYPRQQAVIALWRISHDTNLVSHVIGELEKAPDPKTYKRFLDVLTEIGAAAKPAIPAIFRGTNSFKTDLSRPVREALRKNNPEVAAKVESRTKCRQASERQSWQSSGLSLL